MPCSTHLKPPQGVQGVSSMALPVWPDQLHCSTTPCLCGGLCMAIDMLQTLSIGFWTPIHCMPRSQPHAPAGGCKGCKRSNSMYAGILELRPQAQSLTAQFGWSSVRPWLLQAFPWYVPCLQHQICCRRCAHIAYNEGCACTS